MRRRFLLPIALAAALVTGCAETVRCPDGHVFGPRGECVPIPDGGQADGGTD